jgi:5'-nucleotidase
MSFDLSQLLVIGISSRALFNLEHEDQIFQKEGLQPFIDYQRAHEDDVLRPGSAFPLIKGLLDLNRGSEPRKVEVILLSRNHPDVSLRVFNSIDHHGLDITRAALTGGAPLGPYLGPLKIDLFLSQSPEDVQAAANQGYAAGLIYSPPPELHTAPRQIRIAFDGDCVIFSDEAQKIYDKQGLKAFLQYEEENARKELPDGPFAKLLRTLSRIQGGDPNKSPVRVALVTDRNKPAHERVLRTLRAWRVRIDEAFFLGAIPKAPLIKAFGADMFFEDKKEYCEVAAEATPTGRVLPPIHEDEQVTLRFETGDGPGGLNQFLLVCKSYLKAEYSSAEPQLEQWYRREPETWPTVVRSDFLKELEESVKGTPRGRRRRAPAETDTSLANLLGFIERLASKHRPR